MYTIHQIHRDEYGTVLWTTEYGPYFDKAQAEAVAAEFITDYGYECVIHAENKSEQN